MYEYQGGEGGGNDIYTLYAFAFPLSDIYTYILPQL